MNDVQLTAKFFDVRDTLRRLFPDSFADQVRPLRELLRAEMRQRGGNEFQAFLRVADRLDAVHQMWLMAAVIESHELPQSGGGAGHG